ncbi:hypothetical protein A6R68_06874 [Neotoma lepida]|uniref:Uncharacterized protein n=1 Tax=Neotoma lepida TaxID=56216 RepID=A0A1A6GEB3_NEOLE|nr:hypothetical protein A6R68_06874 [Neotoma lepida]
MPDIVDGVLASDITWIMVRPGPPTRRKNDSLGGNAVNGLAWEQGLIAAVTAYRRILQFILR